MGLTLLCAPGIAREASSAGRVCDVTAYGAKRDGETLDTHAIQAAIDACAKAGGGRVLVPGPGRYLTGTILLKHRITLDVGAGAVLLGSGAFKDYASIDPFIDGVGQSRGACLIGAEGARDIAITGPGTIDGQGELWREGHPDRLRRPFLVRLVRCRNVSLMNLTLVRSPAWTCNLYECERVDVSRLTIRSHANANNDGIDIDGCRKVVIRGCVIDTGDDAICFKTTGRTPVEDVTVRDCDLSSRWGAVKWGTESRADMRRFRISRCRIHEGAGGGFKILSADGARISDIRISDIEMDEVDMPLSILLRSRLRSYRDLPKRPIGSIRDVRLERVRASVPDHGRVEPPTAILVSGIPGSPVENVRLRDLRISVPGGGTLEDARREVPELPSEYPEYGRLGVLPAFGAYLRHAVGIRLDGVRFQERGPDRRPAVVCNDVSEARIAEGGCPSSAE